MDGSSDVKMASANNPSGTEEDGKDTDCQSSFPIDSFSHQANPKQDLLLT